MPKLAIVAALQREVSGLTKSCRRVERTHQGRNFIFFEQPDEEHADEGVVIVCGGIGLEAARRAAEAVIAWYRPTEVQSVGFAGALDQTLHVGDLFVPSAVIDARDGSRIQLHSESGKGTLLTFMAVAGAEQKTKLAQAYQAQAVDMEAAAVLAVARAHGIPFAATKAISDELDFDLPETARFIDAQGRFKTASFTLFVALRPWLWRRVALLARNSRHAAKALGSHFESLRVHARHVVEANIT
jgi:nucleoside phosphorylase